MISLLVPSRDRPGDLEKAIDSALSTALAPRLLEFVVRLDRDDPQLSSYLELLTPIATVIVGPRIVFSGTWDDCWRLATGDIAMLFADDVRFRTPGWDQQILAAFSKIPDRIAVVHGRDGNADRPTHSFVHRRWIETVGRFSHRGFHADYVDTWFEDVSDRIGRRVFLPDLLTEHMHYSLGKAEIDATAIERNARAQRFPRPCDVWAATEPDRERDAGLLRAVMQ